MELKACIEALALLDRGRVAFDPDEFNKVVIKTDSMYVSEYFNAAKYSWPGNKWRTRDGKPVANAQLWKDLTKRVAGLGKRVDILWVPGKSSPHTKAADKLAKGSAKRATKAPLTVTSVRRKKTALSVDPGSVKLTGQRLTIRIVTDEYLKVQRCYKYKYEVMSKGSPYFGRVDLAFSEHLLRAGHTYHVRFNNNAKNPQIEKVFREVA
jgi:ribonuclease HI